MKKFKAKKRTNKLFIYIILFLISICITIHYLSEEELINNNTIISLITKTNLGIDKSKFKNLDFLLKYALSIDLQEEEKVATTEKEPDKLEVEEEIIPTIYIYNTHQEEKYQSSLLEPYNISSTVLIASKIFKEYLEDLKIGVIVEEADITKKIHSLNLKYGNSYEVSRMFLESAKENNPTLKYFIDLHRDSSAYKETTTEINGEAYARVLFVVGLDNPKYEANLNLAMNLKEKILSYNDNLVRGIMKKSGKGVNGVYNQDFDPNTMLIEVGGQYNSISEVNNTLKVLAELLAEFIKEEDNE